ncbi:MAG: molybdate ABC transporter substrate-binding protein [Pseudomonadota bacterium]
MYAFTVFLVASASQAQAADVRIATASNFRIPLEALLADFKTRQAQAAAKGELGSIDVVSVSTGSTGQLYTQIIQGAPFDIFLSADMERPKRLVADGLAVPESRRTYAIGELVLMQRKDAATGSARQRLTAMSFRRLAIANPNTAPYGAAAVALLSALSIRAAVRPKLVVGQNIAQAYQFALSGNVDAALVARANIIALPPGPDWVSLPVPGELHPPIAQDAVLLTRAANNDAARRVIAYLGSIPARAIIAAAGFRLPDMKQN